MPGPDPNSETMTQPQSPQFGSYRHILILSGPLILSHLSVMLMQAMDGLFLAHYSPEAIAAVGPAGMMCWLVLGIFVGIAGYSSTFVAQYIGAKQPQRVGAAVWQAIYISLAGGALIAGLSLFSTPLFAHIGHAPIVAELEATYFRIMCLGGVFFVLGAALSGFFAGRHDNRVLMAAHMLGLIVNGVFNWLLIFGKLGFPEMGIAGAAWATVLGSAITSLLLLALLFLPRHQREFCTWSSRALDWALLKRMAYYGFPMGLRMVVEMLLWTAFLIFVGRVGPLELSASNIVLRINGLAFFPIIGLSIGIGMLVGQAQGAGLPDQSARVIKRGVVIGMAWSVACALAFVLIPHVFVDLFVDPSESMTRSTGQAHDPEQLAQLSHMCVVLLRFVACYVLLDVFNIVLTSALQSAGDTRWTLVASAIAHAGFLLVLLVLDLSKVGLYVYWAAAMVMVMSISLVWIARVLGGKWRSMRVIEQGPPEFESIATAPSMERS